MLIFLAVLLLSSCGILELSIEQPTGTAQPVSPTQIVVNSPAAVTQPPLPTSTLPAEISDPPSSTDLPPVQPVMNSPTPGEPKMVKIYLIAVDDNGKAGDLIGCGDSAVAAQVEIAPTQGVLKAAIQALLAVKTKDYGESGLYNALYQSNLQLDSVRIENGTALVYLSGSLMLGGECDNPRVEAQLTKTALQFSTVNQVSIFINNKLLKDVLSLK